MESTQNNNQQHIAKLSQWDALALESLKAYGWDNAEMINRVQEGNLPKDESKFAFDYVALRALAAEQPELFTQAVQEGYQIKFNTIRGIHSWILIALKHEAELVLDPGKEAVVAQLTANESQLLSSVLSYGWSLQLEDTQTSTHNLAASDDSTRNTYRIAPING